MLIYTHAACLAHDPGPGHPEHAGRLRTVIDALKLTFGERLRWLEAPKASNAQLRRAHGQDLIDTLKAASPTAGRHQLDADTVMSPASLEASERAAGAVCAAVDAVLAGGDTRTFCALRPPGHHSSGDQAMGFCLYNPIAVGAHHALAAHALARVAIVDFDVHHGNGTQAIFEAEPAVIYVSSHQSPLYPGSGRASEIGVGNLLNAELPPGAGSSAFRSLWRERLLPAIDAFRPQLLLISAGFDAHRLDPLADLNLTASDYHWLSCELVDIACRHAQGRIVSTLEGGYSLTALRECSAAHVAALLDAPLPGCSPTPP